jgi:hypothetical protein
MPAALTSGISIGVKINIRSIFAVEKWPQQRHHFCGQVSNHEFCGGSIERAVALF